MGEQLSIPYPGNPFTGRKSRSLMQMSDRMRLLGGGWKQSIIGASEKPPAMPEDIYSTHIGENTLIRFIPSHLSRCK